MLRQKKKKKRLKKMPSFFAYFLIPFYFQQHHLPKPSILSLYVPSPSDLVPLFCHSSFPSCPAFSLSCSEVSHFASSLAAGAVDWVCGARRMRWEMRRERDRDSEEVRKSLKASDAWKTHGGVFKSEVFHSIPLHQKGPPWMLPIHRSNRVACIMPRWFIIPRCLQAYNL